MQRFLALGVLSIAGLAISAADADAFFFHHNHCRHHINRYSTFIACRPYNAFTPVCYGSIVCDGCCPAPMCGGCPPMWRPQTMPPVMAGPGPCCDMGCHPVEHGHGPMYPMPAMHAMPMQPMPMQPMPPMAHGPMPYPQPMPYPPPGPYAQGYAPPYPQPMFNGQGAPGMAPPPGYAPPQANPGAPPGYIPPPAIPPQTSQQWNQQAGYGVQPAGYYPVYPAGHYPVQHHLYPASNAPSYWYGR